MWTVYTAKTLYRTVANGDPIAIDEHYRSDLVLIEERVVSIKARSFDDAIKWGEAEAEKYAKETSFVNPYGQDVTQEYLGFIDVFEPFENLPAGIEVFSSTYLAPQTLSPSQLIEHQAGCLFENERELRLKFCNQEFSGVIT
ncbi:DUF4288 domain-containing protein [Corallincola platygyrae]|uniref:DUF4288 domain-containing protein n=1 Tax=Corallincola platygyrae TaxID=1193278 RepID=A0ABW4XNH9_9GAMM